MGFKAVDHSVNIIAYEKNGKKYSMCCAWSMMVDYDKLICLLGAQSETGKNIKKGDLIGFSSLEEKQENIALKIGDGHSLEKNKLQGINFSQNGSSITVCGAKTELECQVLDILHLEGIEEDNLVYLKIVSSKENSGKFLHMSDIHAL